MPKNLTRSISARPAVDEGRVEEDGTKDQKHRAKVVHKECRESSKVQREKDALAAAAKVNNFAVFLAYFPICAASIAIANRKSS
jgi:hypothetical protein